MRRIVQVLDERVLVFDPPEENPIAQYSKTIIAGGRKTKDMRYAFDRVFDETSTQEDVNALGNHVDHRYLRILLNRYWIMFLKDSMLLYLLMEQRDVEKRTQSGESIYLLLFILVALRKTQDLFT